MKQFRWDFIGYGIRIVGVLFLIAFHLYQQFDNKENAHWDAFLTIAAIVLLSCLISIPRFKKPN